MRKSLARSQSIVYDEGPLPWEIETSCPTDKND